MEQLDKQNTEKNFLSTKAAVLLLSVICCTLWGSAPTGIKLGYEYFQIDPAATMNILLFAGMRFTLAGLMVIIYFNITNRRIQLPKRSSWKAIIPLSFSQTAIQYFFYYIGVANSTGVKSSILSGSSSVISLLMACLVFRQEKLTRNKVIGCIAGIIGIVLVNLQGNIEHFSLDMSLTGEGFVLLSSVSGAVSAVLIRKFSQDENPVMLSGWQFFTGGLMLCAAAVLCGGRLVNPCIEGFGILIHLAMVSAVAYTLRSVLLKYHSVSSVTVYNFLIPIVGVALSAMLLGEKNGINIYTIAAMIFICISIWIISFAKGGKDE